ncbi:MAG TPA: hypothetical protein VKT17_04565, partial [Acidobacteriota bacterium]|nr:hypothetical protein [Acidobacteriota bacterium]
RTCTEGTCPYKKFYQDIYQNRGFEYSATLMQVAPQNPLPAAAASLKHVLPVSPETSFARLRTG